LCCLSRLRGDFLYACSVDSPYKDTVLLIDRQFFGVDEFVLQCFDAIIAQWKLHLEVSLGYPSSLLEKGNHLVEDRVEVHYRPSSSSSNNAFASCKSAVSNPSVNQP